MAIPDYRYLSTDLLSGAVKGDYLSLTVQSFNRAINNTGGFTGSLNLTAGTPAESANWRLALQCRRSVLWAILDGVPVWNGIVWDWVPTTVLDGTLPFSASTMDSLFASRVIEDDLTFTNADVFDVFRGLCNYALTKDVNCGVAGLNLGTAESGVTVTVSWTGSNMEQVSGAWSDLIALCNFEYSFRPGLDTNGNLATFLDLGYPELGQQFPASGLAYTLPGNLLDYQWTETGSSSYNKVIGTGSDSTGSGTTWVSEYPHGYDLVDLAQGFPLLETSAAITTLDVTEQAEVDAFADGVLPSVTGTQLTPLLVLGNEQQPSVKDITLGSWCQVALTSPLHPANADGSPGYQGLARIIGWTLYPPVDAQQAEYTQIQTWIPTSAEQAMSTGTTSEGA